MKNFLILALAVFLLSSCTKEIYRGEVVHVENNKILIDLFGMDKAIWSDEGGVKHKDFVTVYTTNNLKTISVDKLCTPVFGHCHLDGDGLHNRIHIREGGNLTLEYGNNKYISAKIWELDEDGLDELTIHELDQRRVERFDVWIKHDFDFDNSNIYIIRLTDKEDGFVEVDGRQVIKRYTLEEHPGHTR